MKIQVAQCALNKALEDHFMKYTSGEVKSIHIGVAALSTGGGVRVTVEMPNNYLPKEYLYALDELES